MPRAKARAKRPTSRAYVVRYVIQVEGEIVLRDCDDEQDALAQLAQRPAESWYVAADPTTAVLIEDESLHAQPIATPDDED